MDKERFRVSLIWQSVVTAAGGVLAGLALAGGLLRRQQRALTDARYQATHDDTTGLPNRRAALTHLHRCLGKGRPFGVVLLDLDEFKTINDTFGHDAGNDVLVEVARRLAALPDPVGLAARLSGDEFALFVHGDADTVRAAASAASHTISASLVGLGAELIPVRASVGYACARIGITTRLLLRDADEAMYHAKTSGTGVHGHSPATTDRHTKPLRRCRDRRR
jgi:diguanylate cyclase (GGDEF)-like protein